MYEGGKGRHLMLKTTKTSLFVKGYQVELVLKEF